MQLTSLTFLMLLLVSVPVYLRLPTRARPVLLLMVSVGFYAAPYWPHALLIGGLALAVYAVGQSLLHKRRGWLFAIAIAGCVAILAYFKYSRWLLGTLADGATAVGAERLGTTLTTVAHYLTGELRIPLGISFFTFEFVHYLTDVYQGRLVAKTSAAESASGNSGEKKGVLRFLLFALFFPTLLAGPIKRYQQFSAQLDSVPSPEEQREDLAVGLWRILIGLAKKILIADTLATVAVRLQQPDQVTPLGLWLGMYAYAGQIYADFSGYSDLAIGTARLYGYRVPENFNWPYLATSLQEFWRRWHISLSSWIRDYLFIPIGGSRAGRVRAAVNLLVVMALCGLWHGAAWHFVAWGLWHGAGLGIAQLWRRWRPMTQAPGWALHALHGALTFHFVCFGWVLFAAPTLHAAAVAFARMLFLQR